MVAGDERAVKITTARGPRESPRPGRPTERRGERRCPARGSASTCTPTTPDPAPDAVLHLAGLAWPGERPLEGHSDADVAAHAAADALLSAAGLGDLGSNFGTAEPQWAGAAGRGLLARGRAAGAGGRVRRSATSPSR